MDRPDRAFVVLNGARHCLGVYDSPESREAYDRLLAEHAAGTAGSRSTSGVTVTELSSR